MLLFGGLGLSVQDDIRALQKPPQNLLDDQVKLGKILDLATPVQFYLLRAASAEALLQREETLTQRLDPLVQQNQIRGYQAISNWVPSAQLAGVAPATDRAIAVKRRRGVGERGG